LHLYQISPSLSLTPLYNTIQTLKQRRTETAEMYLIILLLPSHTI